MNNFSNYYKNIDKILLLVMGLLAFISVLMIGSTTIHAEGFFSRSVIVQAAAYLLGILLSLILLRFPYTAFLGMEKILYALSILLLLTVYIPGLGVEIFGARSWIDLGFTTIQPSELVKLLYVLILAGYLEQHRDELYNFKCLIKSAMVAAPIILVVLKEDLGSALVFAFVWVVMVFFAGIDIKAFLKFFALVLAAIPIAYVFMADYQKERIEAFLHPDNLNLSGNYQVWQSKIAIGSGGLTGKGLFQGTQKELDFVPVQSSDFIFSVIGEELGFLGGALVIGLLGILLIRMMRVLQNSLDFYGALIVAGFIGMFTFQIFENIAMAMGLMPVTGITLPFLSYGGSSILSNVLCVGVVMNVAVRSVRINF